MKTILGSFCAIFLLIFLSTGVFAQSSKSKKLLSEAEKSFQDGSYSESIKTCKGILTDEPNYYDALFVLGKSYYMFGEYSIAKDLLLALKNKAEYRNIEVSYWLGLTYKALDEYDEAKPLLEIYISNSSDNNTKLKAEIELDGISLAESSTPPATDFNFKNAGEQLNTARDEFAVSLLPVNKKVVVSRISSDQKKSAENVKYAYSQLWMKVDDGDEFDFLNSAEFEGSGTFDDPLQNYFFTQCDNSGRNCRLMWSRNVDGIWLKAVPLPQNAFPSGFEYKDPFLSGDTLFFSSNKRGGIGGMDLWFSIRNNQGFWTIPVNLGEPVNTPFDEVAPFENGNGTFYFSSDGHPGFGLLDVFYVEGLNGNRTIHNLGQPFNSSMNDQHFKIYNQQGYLASNREGGIGGYDIYLFEEQIQKVEVVEETTQETMDQLYSILFSSKIYQLNPKFIGDEYKSFANLNTIERTEIEKQAQVSYAELTDKKISSIINDDKILLASLSKGDRFFVDRIAAAYFENEKALALNLSEEDIARYNLLTTQNKRKLFRLSLAVIDDLKGDFNPLARQTTQKEEMPTPTFKTAAPIAEVEEESDGSKIQAFDEKEEVVAEVNTEDSDVPEEKVVPEEEPKLAVSVFQENISEEVTVKETKTVEVQNPERSFTSKEGQQSQTKDEAFTSYLGVNNSVEFYQNLSFVDKKRVDRIVAIRLVNEKYTLNPGLSRIDKDFYYTLSQAEKDAIDRLRLYFRSWNKDKEFANIQERDLQYLASLSPAKRDQVARTIVRRGIGVDEEDFIRFNNSDWARYKTFSDNEVTMIKDVAQLLKDHDQVFDVALAYATPGYAFNNNLAYNEKQRVPASTVVTSDPELVITGTKLTYESIFFDPGEYAIRKEAKEALNELYEIYLRNPEISLAFESYSYEKANEPQNIQLSTLRANTTKSYLVNKGVPDYKISVGAYSSNYDGSGTSSFQGLTNRKLEISILNSPNVFRSEYTTYFIQPGNTLYSLSKANDMTVEEMMALNGLENTALYAYQPIRVKKTATLDRDFMLESSDELIYQENETPVEVVNTSETTTSTNQNKEMEEVEPIEEQRGSSTMVIGVNESSKASLTRIYTVKKGESIEDIAREFGITVNAIMRENDLKKPKVKKGQKLRIVQ